jgi:hypothetical protein
VSDKDLIYILDATGAITVVNKDLAHTEEHGVIFKLRGEAIGFALLKMEGTS